MNPPGAGEEPALVSDRRRAAVLFVLVLLARLAIAKAHAGNYDTESFRMVADAA